MPTPVPHLIACALLGQAPGPIVPTVAPPELPSVFATNALEQGLSGASVVQACQILDEGVPLCFRVEMDGQRQWFSLQQAQQWGLSLESLGSAVALDRSPNPPQLLPERLSEAHCHKQMLPK